MERVKEIIDGYELPDYPGAVSMRVAVPTQAIPLLFPSENHLHPKLAEYNLVSIKPAPLEDSITGYRTNGIDVSGPTAEVVKASKAIEDLVREWIESSLIVNIFHLNDKS